MAGKFKVGDIITWKSINPTPPEYAEEIVKIDEFGTYYLVVIASPGGDYNQIGYSRPLPIYYEQKMILHPTYLARKQFEEDLEAIINEP